MTGLPAMQRPPLWRQFKSMGVVAPRDILAAFKITRPAVNVADICDVLGISHYRVPGPGWAGALDVKGDHAVIWMDMADSFERNRFTMAHELGHLLLHEEGRLYRDVTFDGSPKESQANAFAVELLMPMWMVGPYVEALPKGDPEAVDEAVTRMAETFGVSKAAMVRRVMEALGNPVPPL